MDTRRQAIVRTISVRLFFMTAGLFLVSPSTIRAQKPAEQFDADWKAGRYSQAEDIAKKEISSADHEGNEGGAGDWSFALAKMYHDRGRYAEAEPLYKRALAISEKALGPDHPNVAMNLNSLALLFDAQARRTEAEPLYKRALAIYEKALGPTTQTSR